MRRDRRPLASRTRCGHAELGERPAAAAAGPTHRFVDAIAELREQRRRRPTLIKRLDKAGFDGQAADR